ncbi:MAG: sigma-70 family RNA polymerase sigma factor [Oscillospiraceae bacterium]|nr:sigma-70 family RNA polymerase sigma factor [Oscillospiraceae bacterium]
MFKEIIIWFRCFLFKNRYIHYINGPETLPPPLSSAEEEEIMKKITSGKLKNRDILIVRNLRLVVFIAKKFEFSCSNIEDLISIGTIGLIKAVGTFCPDKKIKLATYASRCIENEILMHLRKISQHRGETSIDEPLNTDCDGNMLLLSDILGSDIDSVNNQLEREAENQMLRDVVSNLTERERTIMELRFGLFGSKEFTQKEVADSLGISQSYISRLEKQIIKKIKSDLERVS